MEAYATFPRHRFGEVVARTNEDRHPLQVVPYGRFGAGVWTGHPIELVIVLGILLVGLIGIPAWRWFFGATLLVGGLVGYFLRRSEEHTSELQSRLHLVCRLLLEKKKKHKHATLSISQHRTDIVVI